MTVRIAVLTVSDRASRGEYEDLGGPAVKAWLAGTFKFVFNWPGLQAGDFAKAADGTVTAQPLEFCGIVTGGQASAGTVTSCSLGQVNLYGVLATGTFLFIAGLITAAVYAVVLIANHLAMRAHHAQPVDPTLRNCPDCLSEIPRRARRCAFCTAEVRPFLTERDPAAA